MHVSLNWLNDHLDLGGHTTSALAELLTFAGIEVEAIEARGGGLDKVVVAQVTAAEKHPDADRLKVCTVEHGAPKPRQIVCGAQNYQVGDKVPLALPGASLPNGMKIKAGKLRGVASAGMLCSPAELGLPQESDGLWILPEDAVPGSPVADLVGADTVFDLEITPNRPDLLSHLGVARDLAALAGLPLTGKPAHYGTAPTTSSDLVVIEAHQACPFYSARRITGVRIAPSPDWLAKKLTSIGLRPINNVVDITNFVLHEMGQPLHAFDAAKVEGGIRVRAAAADERFAALDGETYTLEAGDLVIADSKRPLALAGIMGGAESGVTDSTTDLIIESAYFDPPGIRRTSRRLALSSDSSYRFERGVDPAQVLGASELATRLITEIAGGTAGAETHVAGQPPASPPPVPLAIDHVRQVLGIPLPAADADQILRALGLEKPTPDGAWIVPSYRLDLTRPIDLVEEIARLHGLDDIPSSTSGPAAVPSPADAAYDHALGLKRGLAALGFHETATIKLISKAQLADSLPLRFFAPPVRLKNPLSDDHTVLRTSLLPGLLASAERNVRMGQRSLKLFEAGTVFRLGADDTIESQHLGLLIAGDASPTHWADSTPRQADIFDLSGFLAFLAPKNALFLAPDDTDGFLLGALISVWGFPVGRAVQLTPARARQIGLECPVVAAELDLERLVTYGTRGRPVFCELPRFPAVTRDVAMELPDTFPNVEVAAFFARAEEPLLQDATLFDLFTDPSGQKLAAGRKSVAYSLTYRHPAKTLTTEEVDTAHQRLLSNLKRSLPATIR
ncbi:phenylalanine--tRNA ligase subunit beta [soil metagenome]